MKVIENSERKNILTIVCCLHGDETFGLDVFGYFKKRIEQYPGLKIILANEEALAAKKRFIDSDLNRCFPGKSNGNHEERLASSLMLEIKNSEYVLDIHTTTSELKVTPIIAKLDQKIKNIINLCSSEEVVFMDREMAKYSLINQISGGVSLEFNFQYATEIGALEEVISMVLKLLTGDKNSPRDRRVFYVDQKIGMGVVIPAGAKNFKLVKSLGTYPFLLYEKSYTNMQGFSAKRVRRRKI